MARSKKTCDSSIETLSGIADMARRSVRDAKTLKSLLIEAGEFEPALLVNSLVKSRTLDIADMVSRVTYKPEEEVYGKPLTVNDVFGNNPNSITVPIIPLRSTVAPLHDNVSDDWRFDGDCGIDLDETVILPVHMNGKHD